MHRLPLLFYTSVVMPVGLSYVILLGVVAVSAVKKPGGVLPCGVKIITLHCPQCADVTVGSAVALQCVGGLKLRNRF